MLPFCVVPFVHGFIITGSRSISPEIPTLSGSFNITGKIDKKTTKGKARVLTDTSPKPSGPIKLTTKLTVDYMLTITSLPSTWTVPRDNSATLLDLSAWKSLPRKSNGDEYSINALIRAEVCLNTGPHPSINPFFHAGSRFLGRFSWSACWGGLCRWI